MIYQGMTMDEYLRHPGINSSKLKLILKTSLDFKEGLEEESYDTRSTILGTAVHTLLLEPQEFDVRYALQTEDFGKKTAGEGKKKWDLFKKENAHKTILDRDDTFFLLKLKEKIRKTPSLRLFLAGGDSEVTATLEEGLLTFKARADLLSSNCIWDVKTTRDGIDDLSLYKTIKKYLYEFQGAHYLYVFNKLLDNRFTDFGWIFVDTASPAMHIRLIKCPESLINRGILKHQHAVKMLQQCTESGLWYGYPTIPQELELPHWAEEHQ